MTVAPFAGAWIEMQLLLLLHWQPVSSRPSRERGLKFAHNAHAYKAAVVAPFAGAWIEIMHPERYLLSQKGRSLRGSVD